MRVGIETMASVSASEVLRGDILIYKSFSLRSTWTHRGIRFGQFWTGSPIHSNSVHAALAVSQGTKDVKVIESTGEGVNSSICDTEADVFRLKGNKKLSEQAACVAERLKEWVARHKTSGGKAAGHYNYSRATFSVVRPGYYGAKASELVQGMRDALEQDKDYENGFFCSMLVALCYDVAAEELGLPSPPIAKDPMNLNPSNLHSYLIHHRATWEFIGTYDEPSGWVDRIFGKEKGH